MIYAQICILKLCTYYYITVYCCIKPHLCTVWFSSGLGLDHWERSLRVQQTVCGHTGETAGVVRNSLLCGEWVGLDVWVGGSGRAGGQVWMCGWMGLDVWVGGSGRAGGWVWMCGWVSLDVRVGGACCAGGWG